MKFSFEIDLQDCGIYDDIDFKQAIKDEAIRSVVHQMYTNGSHSVAAEEVKSFVRKFCRDNEKIILEMAVQRVTENIEKKKAIKELSPSVRELQNANKENEEYFLGLIDKAIAKRFK